MSDPSKQLSVRQTAPFPSEKTAENMGNCASKDCTAKLPKTRKVPGPGKESSAMAGKSCNCQKVTPDYLKCYLAAHPDVLDQYVTESLTEDKVEIWLRKIQMKTSESSPGMQSGKGAIVENRFSYNNLAVVEQKLLADLATKADYLPLLYDFMEVLARALKAQGSSLYAYKAGAEELHLYIHDSNNKYELQYKGIAGLGTDVVCHAAKSGEAIFSRNLSEDIEKFPKGAGLDGTSASSVICLPLTMPTGDCLCIMEFTRNTDRVGFTELDMQTVMAFGSLMGNVAYQCQMNRTLIKQAELNEFLLDVSREIFDDMIIIDNLVEKIMTFTKNLVQADRCGMFLVDETKHEIYSSIFDRGEIDENGKPMFSKQEEIRFPLSVGIAGHVATTQEVINIASAYKDARFNKEVDKKTGYVTHNVLCMPIVSKGSVMGVVQMINKKPDNMGFTKADEGAFKMFAAYSAMALHYSKLYRELLQKTAQHRVATEQITYHSCCTPQEAAEFTAQPRLLPEKIPKDLDSFDFYGPHSKYEKELRRLFVHMMDDIEEPENFFDMRKFCRFITTIKKNYRAVAYHNWKHGFNVAHSVYCILKATAARNIYSTLEKRAMLVASLCHDVDHRGYNNAFFKKFNEPLATLYTNSVMEQHHYATTINLLQQEDHDIFDFLSSADYKETLECMRKAIIATDLALYFGNQKGLAKDLLSNDVDLHDKETVEKVTGLIMTAADLCAVCKPWAVQENTVKYIYEEFYFQGDEEKRLGSSPIPMMDRDNVDNLPKDQVGFIKFVCQPCYQTLYDILPETKPLLDGCSFNLDQWQRVVEGKSTVVWQPADSVTDK